MNPSFLKKISLLMWGLALLAGSAAAQVPLIWKLPPAQTNVIAEGMGNAVAADGTLFNAASFNPALLGRSPHPVEISVPQLNISNDLFEVLDYLKTLQFQADQVYYDLNNGLATNNAGEVNTGLNQIQDVVKNLTDRSLQSGAGLNAAVKIDDHWGVEVYSNLHGFSELWRGNLTQALLQIPFPFNFSDPNSSAAVSNTVRVMAGDLQTGLDQVLTSQQQASVQTDINNLKNGQESVTVFVQNVSNTLSGVNANVLKQALVNSLANDLATLTVLAYLDTVVMGTYHFQPFQGLKGLTIGANLKIVNRHFSYEALTLEGKNVDGAFLDNFRKNTTRWGIDLGFLYEVPAFPLDFGLSLQDLFHQAATIDTPPGSLMSSFDTDSAPLVARIGASWHPVPGLRVNADVDDLFASTTYYTASNGFSRFKLGASYSLIKQVQLRAGFGNQALSGGLGLAFGFFGLDYSYGSDDLSQSYNHYLQTRFVF